MWPSWHNFRWSHPTGQRQIGWGSLTQNLENILSVVEWILASHTHKTFALLPYMPHIFLWKQHVTDDKGAFILSKLKCKKQVCKGWKQGESTRQEYRSFNHACKDGIWNAKILLDGKLTRDVKDSKKSFFRYNSKMKTKKRSGWLEKVSSDLKKWLIFRKEKEENWGHCRSLQLLKRCSALLQGTKG